MAEILQWMLEHKRPETWDFYPRDSYKFGYVLVEINLTLHRSEMNDILNDFPSEPEIKKIERVQHLIQFGLFDIQKERRRNDVNPEPYLGYHVIHSEDKEIALRFPLDYRRYKHRSIGLQKRHNHPHFFSTLAEALRNGRESLSHDQTVVVIVCQRFASINCQADYLPQYVLTFNV